MPDEVRHRVRLRDVAARAGVSVGSASQAFSRPELVSDKVRTRVLEAAEALGYTGPDPAARRLRTGRAGALGLIFSERLRYQFTDPAAPAFLGGVARGMEDAPMGLLLIPDSRFREATAETVRGAAVDGFIIYSAVRNDPRVEAALARGLPTVTVDQPRDAPTPFLGIDDRAAASMAARHLRELGHRRVGVLSFVTAIDREGKLVLEIVNERLAGYREGLGDVWDEDTVRTCRPAMTALTFDQIRLPPECDQACARGVARPPPRPRTAHRHPRDERRARARCAPGRLGARRRRPREPIGRRL